MKIQEKVGKDTGSEIGSIPRSITAVLLEDLIDVCKPGDDVTVVGVVMRRWSALGKGQEGRTGVWTLTHVSIGHDLGQRVRIIQKRNRWADLKMLS